jgi:uncharacterized sulfatase
MRLLLVCTLLALTPLAHGDDPKPNIILILADDLGYGDLGCYGQKKIQTPHLDRLAKEGLRFTQCYAGSTVCAPSRCVLMTGLHTGHCQVRGNSKAELKPGTTTLASVLKQAGYATGHVGKWGLAYPNGPGLPTKQGFDEFLGYYTQMHAHNYYPTYLWKNETKFPLRNVVPNERPDGAGQATEKHQFAPDLFADAALDFIERNKSKPFFLYWSTNVPHANNEAKPHGMEAPDFGIYADKPWPWVEQGFAAMITRMDRDVGRLLDKLKALGLDENTIIFFTSDNGPHREGGHQDMFFRSAGPLRGIKRDLYEGGLRVPLLARWPGHLPDGKTSDHLCYFADFLPTCATLAGAKLSTPTDGLSLVPTLRHDGEQAQHPFLYWEFYERQGARAVRQGKWKAVRVPWDGPLQLFDLDQDITESTNLAAAHPDIVQKLEALMKSAHVPNPDYKVQPPAKK